MELPEELVIEIFKILDINSLYNVIQVNNYYNKLITDNTILENALIDKYKSFDQEDIVDIVVGQLGEKSIKILDLYLISRPVFIQNKYLISTVLELSWNYEILDHLLKRGLNPNGIIYGQTYLEYIINHVNDLDQSMWSDPIEEVAKEYSMTIEVLLKAGADPYTYIDEDRNTVLHLLGHLSLQLLEVFLRHNISLNISNKYGQVALGKI